MFKKRLQLSRQLVLDVFTVDNTGKAVVVLADE